ncbi:hypothetical protein RCO27_15805 [Sphingosinicella sp. LHD-64]|uniref:hypothetical protein n=1 Tax=Sphingosinicella sp. LHD-64 TaxID=3072139 RepID=UPI00280EB392|nr:hypothetical protein [Sphingosinicella sp. LHD-64]MDQ8757694.1 hypothetical protein [Sphingosinicella sp. LHD-64]
MRIYAFASNTLTNIWAGIGASRWAVSPSDNASYTKGRITHALKMPVGAGGILYCNETKSFTTPFIVYSSPNPDEQVENIWPEPWVLPFSIKPLGDPRRAMTIAESKRALPTLRTQGANLNNTVYVHGKMAFTQSKLGEADWMVLIEKLAI